MHKCFLRHTAQVAQDCMELSDAKQHWLELRAKITRVFGINASQLVLEARQIAMASTPPFSLIFSEDNMASFKREFDLAQHDAALRDAAD